MVPLPAADVLPLLKQPPPHSDQHDRSEKLFHIVPPLVLVLNYPQPPEWAAQLITQRVPTVASFVASRDGSRQVSICVDHAVGHLATADAV